MVQIELYDNQFSKLLATKLGIPELAVTIALQEILADANIQNT